MKTLLIFASVIIIVTGFFNTLHAQSPTTTEISAYKLYLCSFRNGRDEAAINEYATQSISKVNNFTYQEDVERKKASLRKELNSVSFTKRFSDVFESKLGDYSFSDHGFPLKKLTSHLKLPGTWIYYLHPDEVINLDEFTWFVPMPEAKAKVFVETHPEGFGVLLRITYSVVDHNAVCKTSDTWFKTFFHSIEVFDAKTRTLIATFKASTTPEQARIDAPSKFRELLATLPELTAPGWDGRFKLGIKSFDPKTGAVIAEIEQRQSSLNGVLVERPDGYSRRIEGNVSGNTLELTGTWTDTLVVGGGSEDFPMRLKLWYDGAAHKLVGRIVYKDNPDSGVVMSFPIP